MKIIVVGGGKVGYYLTKTLLAKGHQVSLIEKEETRCQRIAEEFDILTINGDGTSIYNLADAGADNTDVVAAVTGSDEENLVACQMAKRKFAVPRTIARINNPKNERIFTELGVDTAISSTSLIAQSIEKEVVKGIIKTLLTFDKGDMEIVEVDLRPDAPAVNKSVQELAKHLPKDALLVSIIRGENSIIPKGDTIFAAGDAVIALTTVRKQDELKKVLAGKKAVD